MSTDITLVGIGKAEVPCPEIAIEVPCVVTEIWVGLSTLKHTLEEFAESLERPIQKDPTATDAGFDRYLVTNPLELAADLEVWRISGEPDGCGYDGFQGSQDIVDAIRANPDLTWWFHVDF